MEMKLRVGQENELMDCRQKLFDFFLSDFFFQTCQKPKKMKVIMRGNEKRWNTIASINVCTKPWVNEKCRLKLISSDHNI